MIAKNELISRVWGGVVVQDTNLRVHISVLRRLLGDDGCESRYIVHAARRGYVFVAPVVRFDEERGTHSASVAEVRGAARISTPSVGGHSSVAPSLNAKGTDRRFQIDLLRGGRSTAGKFTRRSPACQWIGNGGVTVVERATEVLAESSG